MQSRLNDARIVEDHQTAFGQQRRQGAELSLANLSTFIDKQFAAVSLGQGELRYAVFRQSVVVVAYLNVLRVHKTAAKLQRK